MSNIEILKEKCIDFRGEYLCYLIGLDEDGDQICEIDGSESYCPNCIKKVVSEYNEKLARDYDIFRNNHDFNGCEDKVCKVDYATESNPEKDDFCICDKCGCEIDVGVLFTFSQEIDHWLDADINLNDISDQDAYRLYMCIESEDAKEKHPELTIKLREKIEKL